MCPELGPQRGNLSQFGEPDETVGAESIVDRRHHLYPTPQRICLSRCNTGCLFP
jgi:hypothetical protein